MCNLKPSLALIFILLVFRMSFFSLFFFIVPGGLGFTQPTGDGVFLVQALVLAGVPASVLLLSFFCFPDDW